MRYCSTWLKSLLCYIKKFVIEEFVIRVLHCTYIHCTQYICTCTYTTQYICTLTQYVHMYACTCQLFIVAAVTHCTVMITFLSTLSLPHTPPPLHHHNCVQHSVCDGRAQEMSRVDSNAVSTGTNGMDRARSESPSVYCNSITARNSS